MQIKDNMKLNLAKQLKLNILFPILLGASAIVLVALITSNNGKNKWYDLTNEQMHYTTLSTTKTKSFLVGNHIVEYFDQTINDISVLTTYIGKSVNNELVIDHNYRNYFGISSIDPNIPTNDIDGDPLATVTFLKGINTVADLHNVNSYSLNGSTIYDNIFRAIYKSSSPDNIYFATYFGFESNGLFRRYPYTNLNSYTTVSYTCYYNNLNTIGYDPRCRDWYVLAKYDDNIHFMSPSISALTGKTRITVSKRVLDSSNNLIGIMALDVSMDSIDNVIIGNYPTSFSSGYNFLMSSDGTLISYPNLDRSVSPPLTVQNKESSIPNNVWTTILLSTNESPQSIETTKDGDSWVIVYTYLPSVDYYLVMMYKNSDVDSQSGDIFSPIDVSILIGTIVIPILLALIFLVNVCTIESIGKQYLVSIESLSQTVQKVDDINADIELGNRAAISSEFTNLDKNFGNLLVALRFGNSAYYSGDMNKALTLYNSAEELMKTLGSRRGLSICYNNKANVYKQLGDSAQAEQLYLQSIDIINELVKSETVPEKMLAYKVMLSYRKMNLGVLYKDCNRFAEAKIVLEESMKLAMETDNSLGISKISGNLAQFYLQSGGNVQSATSLIEGAYETVKNSGDEISVQYAMMNIGILELHKKNYPVALNWFGNIFKSFSELDAYVKQTCTNNARVCLIALGRHDDANALDTPNGSTKGGPKSVLFVLDCSGSMTHQKFLSSCKSNVISIIEKYLSDSDIISMIVFNDKVTPLFNSKTKRNNMQEMINRIGTVSAGGQTAFYGAIIESVNVINKTNSIEDKAKWIIALTDGEDTCSKQLYQNLRILLRKSSVNLIIITVGALENRKDIEKLCEDAKINGIGKLIEISRSVEELDKTFKKVAKLIIGQLHVDAF